ncbi:MAG: efflux RND transporter periplasmic adaptor subunit [Alphaproteobacteria bacterium]|jgi:membrane fusion protein, multidrug efflux system|nr:efflux RND transporter periplasmic adaptor subunit [Alphaproteobacteria bacterium]MBT5390668.1 efflux RND transporter periplasmic adaptor subunit [Alphaproteobacteria bacterium]MBT5654060.1 efflux RND transporter periplasmic adaptor subunit [Alphaproteobacteria bacterium]
MPRFLKAGVALLLVLTLGGGYYWWSAKKAEESAAQKAAGPRPVVVEAEPVTVRKFATRVKAVGTLTSNESVVIRPEVEGRISKILFKGGTPVKMGDPLIQLDEGLSKAKLSVTNARLKAAKAEYNRLSALAEQKYVKMSDYEKALAQYRVSEAEQEEAEIRLSQTILKAPFEGVVGLKDVSIGHYVRPGEDLLNLEDVDPIKVDFQIGEIFLQKLKVGQQISAKVDGFPWDNFTGVIEGISPKVDPVSHSIRVRASIDNPEHKLRSGLFAALTLTLKENEDAIMVPEIAVEFKEGENVVFRVINGTAVRTPVTLGGREGGLVEIEDGLMSWDTVVTAGAMKVVDGIPVEVIPSIRKKDEVTRKGK